MGLMMKNKRKRWFKSFLTLLLIVSSVIVLVGCQSTIFDKNYKYRDYYIRYDNDGSYFGYIYGSIPVLKESEQGVYTLYHKKYFDKFSEAMFKFEEKEVLVPFYIYAKTYDAEQPYVKVNNKKFDKVYYLEYNSYIKVSDITNIFIREVILIDE